MAALDGQDGKCVSFLPSSYLLNTPADFCNNDEDDEKEQQRYTNRDLKFLNCELCFMHNSFIDQRLGCDARGGLFFSDRTDELGVFHFIKAATASASSYPDDEFLIASWKRSQKRRNVLFLSSDPDGNVFTSTTKNKPGKWERWRIRRVNKRHLIQPARETREKSEEYSATEGAWIIESVAHGRVLATQRRRQRSLTPTQQHFVSSKFQNHHKKEQLTIKRLLWQAQEDLQRIPCFPYLHQYEDTINCGNQTASTMVELLHTATKVNDDHSCCEWHLEAAHSHVYYVTSPCHNLRIGSSVHGRPMVTDKWSLQTQWQIQLVGNDSHRGQWWYQLTDSSFVSLYSATHRAYLGSTSDGQVTMLSCITEASIWELEECEKGQIGQDATGIFLVSLAYHRKLSCDDRGNLSTVLVDRHDGKWETWQLKPRLPSTNKRWISVVQTMLTTWIVVGVIIIIAVAVTIKVALGSMACHVVRSTYNNRLVLEPLVIHSSGNLRRFLVSLLPSGDF